MGKYVVIKLSRTAQRSLRDERRRQRPRARNSLRGVLFRVAPRYKEPARETIKINKIALSPSRLNEGGSVILYDGQILNNGDHFAEIITYGYVTREPLRYKEVSM